MILFISSLEYKGDYNSSIIPLITSLAEDLYLPLGTILALNCVCFFMFIQSEVVSLTSQFQVKKTGKSNETTSVTAQ